MNTFHMLFIEIQKSERVESILKEKSSKKI